QRLRAFTQAIDELTAHDSERFGRFNARGYDVAIAEEQLKFAKGIVIRRPANAFFENLDSLKIVDVIEDNPRLAANDFHGALFVRIDPAHVNLAEDSVRIEQMDKHRILAALLEMADAKRIHPNGSLAQEI